MNFSESDFLAQLNYKCRHPVLIDVGAHSGTFARPFARKGWTVIAFEPEVKNYRAFIRNLSGFKRVTCIPKAVLNTSGQRVPFYVSEEHYGIHSLKPFHDTHKFAYEVETIRLDEALSRHEVQSVTLLKIDIEGADFLALQGFDIEKYRPELIMIEFMDDRSRPNFDYIHHDVADYMKQRGYVSFISEWAPIQEYAREGVEGDSHIWIACERYPLKHDPAWGNMFFVPEDHAEEFEDALQQFLASPGAAKPAKRAIAVRRWISKIPGSQFIYNKICDMQNRHLFF
jgi:FkbM family methyltransferase